MIKISVRNAQVAATSKWMSWLGWAAAGFLLAGGCSGPPSSGAGGEDGAIPDACGPDGASSDAASSDAATPDAAIPDAAIPDAAIPDAAIPDAAIPDAGGPDGGSICAGQSPPITGGNCSLWRVGTPTPADYGAPFPIPQSASGGVFVVADTARVLRHEAGAWTVELDDSAFATPITHATSASGFAAVLEESGQVWYHDGAMWQDAGFVPEPIESVAGAGSDLFVAVRDGRVLRYDGAVWLTIRSATNTRLDAMWTDGLTVYGAIDFTITVYDGISWVDDVSPIFEGWTDVAGVPGGDVYAIGAGDLYVRSAGNWVTATPFACAAASYHRLDAGGDLLLVEATCGGQPQAWLFDGGAGTWSQLPALPAGATDTELRATGAGVFLGGADLLAGQLQGASWQLLPPNSVGVELPLVPFTVAGRGASDMYIGGSNGIAKLDGDTWCPITSPPDRAVLSLYVAPDGMMFAGTTGACTDVYPDCDLTSEVWRYDGSTWTHDLTIPDTMSFYPRQDMYGTSSSNVYLIVEQVDMGYPKVYMAHWDGTSWTMNASLFNTTCGYQESPGDIALAGDDLWIQCTGSDDLNQYTPDLQLGQEVYLGEGGSLYPLRPYDAPEFLLVKSDLTAQVRTPTGWILTSYQPLPGGHRIVGGEFPTLDIWTEFWTWQAADPAFSGLGLEDPILADDTHLFTLVNYSGDLLRAGVLQCFH